MFSFTKSATAEKVITAVQQKYKLTPIEDLDDTIQRQIICLALNLYHEARGTSDASVMAVGFATRNRVVASNDKNYCSVIWQKGQYVWTKRPIRGQLPKDVVTWSKLVEIATHIVTSGDLEDTTSGADSFYSTHIRKPRWAFHSPTYMRIGSLVFVKQLR